MKHLHNEADRVRRYSQALVTASLTVRPAVDWPKGGIAPQLGVAARWRAQLSLTAGAALGQRRIVEA